MFSIKKFVVNPWKNFVQHEKWVERNYLKIINKISNLKLPSFTVRSTISLLSFSFLFPPLVNYKKHNDSKNVFAFSRTPTTFISTMVICYLIAGILDAVWLGGINFIFMFAFWLCFVLLTVWLYTKYSGEYAEIGEYIDYFADVIWNNVSGRIDELIKRFLCRVFILFIRHVYAQQCDL